MRTWAEYLAEYSYAELIDLLLKIASELDDRGRSMVAAQLMRAALDLERIRRGGT